VITVGGMELRYLRYFVAVAERRNFTRAAADLHVAQPAISQQIKALEDELEVILLLRNKRSVSLTAAGEIFLAEAREILARAELAKHHTRQAARGEVGSLSIACFSSATSGFLPELIQRYRAEYPAVRIRLAEMTPEQQINAFDKEEIDIGFTRPLPQARSKEFTQDLVYQDRILVALPTSHPLANRRDLTLEKLSNEDFVLFARSEAPALVEKMMLLCADAGFVPRILSEPLMMQTVLMCVAAGVGVSLVPGCVRNFQQPGVILVPLKPTPDPIDLIMISRRSPLSPTVVAWRDLCVREFPEMKKGWRGKLPAAISQSAS
jgi:DNA-binding transcriptional LysR family regulator